MRRHLPILLMVCMGLTAPRVRSAPAPSPLPGGAASARDDRRGENPRRFDDHDRKFAHDYYDRHRHDRGFRDRDRLDSDFEARIHEGYVLDPDMRRLCRPAPRELVRGLAPAPYGYRYVVVGGHVCLIDNDYRVHDAIHLELNLGL